MVVYQWAMLTDDMDGIITSKHPEVNYFEYESRANRPPVINLALHEEEHTSTTSNSPDSSLYLTQSQSSTSRRRSGLFHLPSFSKPKAPDSPESQKSKELRPRTDSAGSDHHRIRVPSFSFRGRKDSETSAKDRPLSFIGNALPKPRADGSLLPTLDASAELTRRSSKLHKPRDSSSSSK